MAFFLKDAAPIVRGLCDDCGASRNIWFAELGAEAVPCDHRDRGCAGHLRIAYRGLKAFLPAELANPRCRCCDRSGPPREVAAGHATCSDTALAKLTEMGFPEAEAQQALAQGGGVEAALDHLMEPSGAEPSPAVAAASACAPASASSCGGMLVEDLDLGECAICTEDLLLADAAMRCAGQGGKKHYFHAHCLTAWVRQCQSAGAGPTCPACRGPVQVRSHRLEEFLREKGSKLDADDHEALRTFHAGAESSTDGDGWSNLRSNLFTAGTLLAVAGIGVAIAAGIHALSNQRGRRRDEQR